MPPDYKEDRKEGQEKMGLTLYRTEQKVRPIEAQRPALSREELEAVLECLIEDRIGSGATVQKFEKAFSNAFSVKHTVALQSLAASYHLALLALEAGAEDHIWMSALSPVAALDAARYTNLNVHLLDAGRNSFHPSAEAVTAAVEESKQFAGKKFYIYDHTYGSPSVTDTALLKEAGFIIIEDITGLVGSESENRTREMTGEISVCGLSAYDLLTTGNGGVVVTENQTLARKLKSLRYGSDRDHNRIAFDYRLEDFQAAMGLHQLSRLGLTLSRRKKIGIKYLETLRQTKHETYFTEPLSDTYHFFPVVISKSQDEVKRYFASLQIGTTKIPEPLHHFLDLPRLEFPNAERLFQKAVCIPVYPALTANNVERIASSLRGLL